MEESEITLTSIQFQHLLQRKAAIESKFGVSIVIPGTDNSVGFPVIYGEEKNILASTKYIFEALVYPEIIEIYSYHMDLESIYCSRFWNEIIERIHNVVVSKGSDNDLTISGAELSVKSAVSYLQKLNKIYRSSTDCSIVNKSLAHELSEALRTFKRIDLEPVFLYSYPDGVNELLLSWLKEINGNHFLICDTGKLNPSIDISGTLCDTASNNIQDMHISYQESDSSVIAIDSDNEEKSNKKVKCKKFRSTKKTRRMKVPARQETSKKKNKRRRKNKLLKVPGNIAHPAGRLHQIPQSTAIKRSQLNKSYMKTCAHSKLPDVLSQRATVTARPPLQPKPNKILPNVIQNTEETRNSLPDAGDPRKLRPVVIDGSNIAVAHGQGKVFSCRGIDICIKYFQDLGHTDITALVPQSRRHNHNNAVVDRDILEALHERQLIVFTPSKKIATGETITCYDDRFIVDLAVKTGGVVVSNDGYRDLLLENAEWRTVITERVLMFCFVRDIFMLATDPYGMKGPHVKDVLRFPLEKHS